mgnify:CR=1 FL=1
MKISSKGLKDMIAKILYLRSVMVYEIRYMGEDLLTAMEDKNENHKKTA